MSNKSLKLDKYDYQLLAEVQENSKISTEALGEQLGLSTAAVQRRLKKLRREKVIQKDVAVIDPEALGLSMQFVVAVELERDDSARVDEFKKNTMTNPHVQQCYYVTGATDFYLFIVAKDMSEYERVTRELFMADENVRSFSTSVVMGLSKHTLELPIPELKSDT